MDNQGLVTGRAVVWHGQMYFLHQAAAKAAAGEELTDPITEEERQNHPTFSPVKEYVLLDS